MDYGGLCLEDLGVLDEFHWVVDCHGAHQPAVVAERHECRSIGVQEPVDDRDVGAECWDADGLDPYAVLF